MLKRTLVFTTPLQLSLKNSQIVISFKEMPTETRTVPVEDVGMVIIENQMISVTLPLLNELVDAGVAVVLCDKKGLPHAMLQNMDGHNLQGEFLRNQVEVGEVLRKQLWKQIVEAKIKNQSALLEKIHKKGDLLKPHYMNVKSGDSDNREGIAARLYWEAMFGDGFVRDRNELGINSLLNYGYTILRAATARALVSSGLTPSLGIFHHNRSNAFPLADDLMEPYRPFVDEIVYHLCEEGKFELNKETKVELMGILSCDTFFPKVTRPLQIGLSITMASLAKCYAGEQKKLSLPMLK
ncbi:MAG: type II CRISPR-associated endonuclease Cas1 [Bacteroidaceae bacterium]|nr:type II CRISPR-associated endonuclease Cas1 [Bacteroidaceae bacterium]